MNTPIFHNLLQEFCQGFDREKIDSNIPSIFIPHTMAGYAKADKKIFYIGRDTSRWWGDISYLLNYFDQNKTNDYITETASWMQKLDFFGHNKNKAGGFWTLVVKLHLKLKGINEIYPVSERFPDEMKIHLNDFGWGNTNAIEVTKSLETREVWNNIDKQKYSYIKSRSTKFDKLKHIIECYAPDYIFIFHWARNADDYLEGLEIENFKKLEDVNDCLWVYTLKNTNTKIIWTVHPNFLRFQKGMNVDKLVDILVKTVKEH